MDDFDELYLRARNYVEESRDASCAGLQCHLRIGYGRALQLKERLAASGAYDGMRFVMEPERWAIKVVGIGDAGCNALAALPSQLPEQLKALAISREGVGALLRTRAHPVVLAHANTASGDIAAIEAALAGANLVILAAGLSGADGSDLAPLVVQAARRIGAVSIATAYIPAAYERQERIARAAGALDVLERDCDAVLVSSLQSQCGTERQSSPIDLLDRRDREFAAFVLALSEMLLDERVLRPSLNELLLLLAGRLWMGTARAGGPTAVDDAMHAACAQLIQRGAPVPVDGMLALLRMHPAARFVKAARLTKAAEAVAGPETRTSIAYHLDEGMGTSVEVTLLAARRESICRAST